MTVEEAVKANETKALLLFSHGTVKEAQRLLAPGEEALVALIVSVVLIRGSESNKDSGIVILTDSRVLFVSDLKKYMRRVVTELPVSDVRSMERSTKLSGTYLSILGTSLGIAVQSTPRGADALQQGIEQIRRAPAAAAAAAPAPTLKEQLRDLKELYDEGILTDEEYAAKKQQLLEL